MPIIDRVETAVDIFGEAHEATVHGEARCGTSPLVLGKTTSLCAEVRIIRRAASKVTPLRRRSLDGGSDWQAVRATAAHVLDAAE